MSYLNRIDKAKKLLASITNRPENSLELKYGNMNAEQAWNQFFLLFEIRFKHRYQITADTSPIQWKTLSDIYNFLDDMVIKLSETVKDFKFLLGKYGKEDYPKYFNKHYEKISDIVSEIKVSTQTCKKLAVRYQLTQHTLYKKYEIYLNELTSLTPNSLFDAYFLKGQMPLDNFDTECVEKEGDPIKNLSPKIQ
jgi:hypothetical protein